MLKKDRKSTLTKKRMKFFKMKTVVIIEDFPKEEETSFWLVQGPVLSLKVSFFH